MSSGFLFYICIMLNKQKQIEMKKVEVIEAKIVGYTDNVTSCDRCGKTNISGTYVVVVGDQEYYLGSTCVKKKFELNQKQFRTFITDEQKRLSEEREANIQRDFVNQYPELHKDFTQIYNTIQEMKKSGKRIDRKGAEWTLFTELKFKRNDVLEPIENKYPEIDLGA